MGRRRTRVRQEQLWTPTASLPVSASHPFYKRLNRVLEEKKFDDFAEGSASGSMPKQWGGPDWRLVSTSVC
jgi:hypothetical protein